MECRLMRLAQTPVEKAEDIFHMARTGKAGGGVGVAIGAHNAVWHRVATVAVIANTGRLALTRDIPIIRASSIVFAQAQIEAAESTGNFIVEGGQIGLVEIAEHMAEF